MYYHVETQNLMTVPQGYCLVHCISADLALGAGVAKQIDQEYGMRTMLKEYVKDEKAPWPSCIGILNVLNLVTKEKCWHKPTLDDLEAALWNLHECVETLHIKKLAMPKIGCGLDRLEWEDVEPILQEMFSDLDVEIMVCVLPD